MARRMTVWFTLAALFVSSPVFATPASSSTTLRTEQPKSADRAAAAKPNTGLEETPRTSVAGQLEDSLGRPAAPGIRLLVVGDVENMAQNPDAEGHRVSRLHREMVLAAEAWADPRGIKILQVYNADGLLLKLLQTASDAIEKDEHSWAVVMTAALARAVADRLPADLPVAVIGAEASDVLEQLQKNAGRTVLYGPSASGLQFPGLLNRLDDVVRRQQAATGPSTESLGTGLEENPVATTVAAPRLIPVSDQVLTDVQVRALPRGAYLALGPEGQLAYYQVKWLSLPPLQTAQRLGLQPVNEFGQPLKQPVTESGQPPKTAPEVAMPIADVMAQSPKLATLTTGLEEGWRKRLPQEPVWLQAEDARRFLDTLLDHQESVPVGYVLGGDDLHDTNTVDVVRGRRRGTFQIRSQGPGSFLIRKGDRLIANWGNGLTFVSGSAGVRKRLWDARKTTARALLKTLGLATGLEEQDHFFAEPPFSRMTLVQWAQRAWPAFLDDQAVRPAVRQVVETAYDAVDKRQYEAALNAMSAQRRTLREPTAMESALLRAVHADVGALFNLRYPGYVMKDSADYYSRDVNELTVALAELVGGPVERIMTVALSEDLAVAYWARAAVKQHQRDTKGATADRRAAQVAISQAEKAAREAPAGILESLQAKDQWIMTQLTGLEEGPAAAVAYLDYKAGRSLDRVGLLMLKANRDHIGLRSLPTADPTYYKFLGWSTTTDFRKPVAQMQQEFLDLKPVDSQGNLLEKPIRSLPPEAVLVANPRLVTLTTGLEEGPAAVAPVPAPQPVLEQPVVVDFSRVYATKAAEGAVVQTLARIGARPGDILRPPQDLAEVPARSLVAYDGSEPTNAGIARVEFTVPVARWDVAAQTFETADAFFLWYLQALGHPVSAIREIRWSDDGRTAEVFA